MNHREHRGHREKRNTFCPYCYREVDEERMIICPDCGAELKRDQMSSEDADEGQYEGEACSG